jgi:NitT/TauT family transport system substrate-binding protein
LFVSARTGAFEAFALWRAAMEHPTASTPPTKLRVFDHGGWALPWRVAQAEGDFAAEGLDVEILDWDPSPAAQAAGTADLPTAEKERKLIDGQIDVYGACEWGLIKRIADLGTGRIIGMRRGMGMPMKLFVMPASGIVNCAGLAGRPVAINENSGSHYVAIDALEQYMPRDQVQLVHIGQPFARYEALVRGDVAGALILEPYSTLAEIQGARCLLAYPGRGGIIAGDGVSTEVRERFRHAVARASERINADPERYKELLVGPLAWTGVPAELVAQVRERLVMPKYYPPEEYDEGAFAECYDWMRTHELVRPGVAYRDVVMSHE